MVDSTIPTNADDRTGAVRGDDQHGVTDASGEVAVAPSTPGGTRGRFSTSVWDFLFDFERGTTPTRPELPRIVLLAYATLVSVLMVVSTGLLSTATLAGLVTSPVPIPAISIGFPVEVTVPAYMYAYAMFGTTAYIFANKISTGSETLKPRQAFYRVFAVLPVVAGVYLLWGVLWPDVTASPTLQAGIAFLTGLYVELAIAALAVVADRFVPAGSTDDEDERSTPAPIATEEATPAE